MSKHAKTIRRILSRHGDANHRFIDVRHALVSLGFTERTKGSHHIFARKDIDEILNLQSKHGMAKPYQIRQIRDIIVTYGLGPEDEQHENSSEE